MAQMVFAAAAVVSAISTYKKGKTSEALYNLQARQETIKGDRERIRLEDQANQVVDALNRNNAAISARAGAGGVGMFSGSAAQMAKVSEMYAGQDMVRSLEAGAMAQSMGQAQAGILRATGKEAMQSATVGAITSLAMAGAQMYSLGTTPSAAGGSAAAPAASTSWFPSFDWATFQGNINKQISWFPGGK